MNLTLSFNLQRATMVEVVTRLIQCNIPRNLKKHAYSHWEEKEEKVVESKIQKLEIPIMCKKAMTRMVKPIFRRIRYADDKFSEHLTSTSISSIHKCIRLTSVGTVDLKRSVEVLLDLSIEELPKLMRYKLSRIFCLKDQFDSCYDDLDEADQMRLPGSLDYLFVVPESLRNLSYFEYAVLNGNEVAARHFWNAEEKLKHPTELVMKIRAGKLEFHRETLRGLYLFLLSCFPDDKPLQEALLDSVPFLVSLFDWPYLDKVMELFHRMPEERKYLNMGSLIYEVFQISRYRRMDGDYVDTLQYFLNEFLATDKGLTTRNTEAGTSLIPYRHLSSFRLYESYVRYGEVAWEGGWTSQWHRIVIYIIDFVLLKMHECDKNTFRFVRLLLELLGRSHKVQYCELRAADIADLIRANRHRRLKWLFKCCLTNEQSKGIKESLWGDENIWRAFNEMDAFVGAGSRRRLNEFAKFCCMPHRF